MNENSTRAILVQPGDSSLNSPPEVIIAPPTSDSPSTIAKVISFGVNNLLVAVHLIGIGALLTSLGPDEAAAAPLASSLLAVINGTVVGILLMTLVTVVVGWLIGHFKDENPTPMFWIRDIAVALTAVISCYRFSQHMKSDVKLYSDGLDKLGVPQDAEERKVLHGGWCSFMPSFRSKSSANDNSSLTTSNLFRTCSLLSRYSVCSKH